LTPLPPALRAIAGVPGFWLASGWAGWVYLGFIYFTEAGFRGMLGSRIIQRTQAQFMTRLAIILKGEGIRVFLPFSGIDYDRDGWWGFCFNLEVDAQSPWSTQHISPKPSVNALAVCVGMLEGAVPKRRVEGLGETVWAYAFERDGLSILAVWRTTGQASLALKVGKDKSFELVDIMGHTSQVASKQGVLEIPVDGSVHYLLGSVPGDYTLAR